MTIDWRKRAIELEGALRKCAEIAECVWKHGGAHTIDVLIGKDDRTHVVQGDALKEIRYVARTLLARPGGEERKPSLTDDCGKCQRLRLNCECPEGPTDVWLCWSESKGWHNSTTPGAQEQEPECCGCPVARDTTPVRPWAGSCDRCGSVDVYAYQLTGCRLCRSCFAETPAFTTPGEKEARDA